jgi:hypothetical protein
MSGFLVCIFLFVPLVSRLSLLVHEGVNFYPLRVRGGDCSGNFCPFTMWPWKLYLSIGLRKGEMFSVQSPFIIFRSEQNGKQWHCTCFHKVAYILRPSFPNKLKTLPVYLWNCTVLLLSVLDTVLNRTK